MHLLDRFCNVNWILEEVNKSVITMFFIYIDHVMLLTELSMGTSADGD